MKFAAAENRKGEGARITPVRKYFCSCGGALTAEEYITHYFDLGHDRGDPAFTASAAPVVDNGAERVLSVKELAEAALLSLERLNTEKLAALGRDGDASAIGDARRCLDRLLYEIGPLCGTGRSKAR